MVPTSGKALIKELKKAGFVVQRVKGSHYFMEKNNLVVVVPNHSYDLPKGTEMDIRKKAGIKK